MNKDIVELQYICGCCEKFLVTSDSSIGVNKVVVAVVVVVVAS